MLQPLWESRDRYEELKQIDDTKTEVKVASLRPAGPTPPTLLVALRQPLRSGTHAHPKKSHIGKIRE